MNKYPSNISREQFEIIKTDLEMAKKKTKPRKQDLYEIFCAVLYVLKSGCQWRMLPKDFPKWSTIYFYFRIWSEQREGKSTILAEVLKKSGMSRKIEKWEEEKLQFPDYRCAKR